jgi:hypothetical protein
MRRFAATVAVLAVLAGCATPRADLRPTAHPSAVIATELAFARAAREKGQWTAFRQYATGDAVMFVPQQVKAQDWLRKQTDPPQAVQWRPHQVWSSCDGSFVVSVGGADYPDGSKSGFLTVWQQQSNGKYLWVLDQALPDGPRPAETDMIGAAVGDCAADRPARRIEVRRDENWRSGLSNDRTLAWSTEVAADCMRTVSVRLLEGGEMSEVFHAVAPAPASAGGAAASCS